jgi:hypothetical protein
MEDTIAGLRGQLADEMGLTEQQRARAEAAEARADALADEYHREYVLASTHAVVVAENTRLRGALQPFARDAEAFDNAEGTYGDEPVFERMSSEYHWRFRITDVRRARAALAAGPKEEA